MLLSYIISRNVSISCKFKFIGIKLFIVQVYFLNSCLNLYFVSLVISNIIYVLSLLFFFLPVCLFNWSSLKKPRDSAGSR